MPAEHGRGSWFVARSSAVCTIAGVTAGPTHDGKHEGVDGRPAEVARQIVARVELEHHPYYWVASSGFGTPSPTTTRPTKRRLLCNLQVCAPLDAGEARGGAWHDGRGNRLRSTPSRRWDLS